MALQALLKTLPGYKSGKRLGKDVCAFQRGQRKNPMAKFLGKKSVKKGVQEHLVRRKCLKLSLAEFI